MDNGYVWIGSDGMAALSASTLNSTTRNSNLVNRLKNIVATTVSASLPPFSFFSHASRSQPHSPALPLSSSHRITNSIDITAALH